MAGRYPHHMPQSKLESIDLSNHQFSPNCDQDCGRTALYIGQGCMDAMPVLLCQDCLDRGLEVITSYVRLWQRLNKRVMICGDCYRPLFNLDTHLEVRKLQP